MNQQRSGNVPVAGVTHLLRFAQHLYTRAFLHAALGIKLPL